MKRVILGFALFIASFSFLAADGGTATIVYADGKDLSIIRDRKELKVDDPIGYVVQAGDLVQTGKNTVIELLIKPKKAVVRVSGNTTFQFRGSYPTGETSLAVLYGRVRAKVEKLAGTERFTMRNDGTVAGVRGTDFGMDVVISKDASGGQTKVSVYSFEGDLSVESALSASSSVQASATVKAGEMAQVLIKGEDVSLSTVKLSDEVQGFWKDNPFKSADASSIVAPPPEPAVAEQATPVAVAASTEKPEDAATAETPKLNWGFEKRTLAIKNSMLVSSVVLVAAGAGLEIYGAYRVGTDGADQTTNLVLLGGGISASTGLMCGLFSLLLNPSIPPK
jgi:hypothetical protein